MTPQEIWAIEAAYDDSIDDEQLEEEYISGAADTNGITEDHDYGHDLDSEAGDDDNGDNGAPGGSHDEGRDGSIKTPELNEPLQTVEYTKSEESLDTQQLSTTVDHNLQDDASLHDNKEAQASETAATANRANENQEEPDLEHNLAETQYIKQEVVDADDWETVPNRELPTSVSTTDTSRTAGEPAAEGSTGRSLRKTPARVDHQKKHQAAAKIITSKTNKQNRVSKTHAKHTSSRVMGSASVLPQATDLDTQESPPESLSTGVSQVQEVHEGVDGPTLKEFEELLNPVDAIIHHDQITRPADPGFITSDPFAPCSPPTPPEVGEETMAELDQTLLQDPTRCRAYSVEYESAAATVSSTQVSRAFSEPLTLNKSTFYPVMGLGAGVNEEDGKQSAAAQSNDFEIYEDDMPSSMNANDGASDEGEEVVNDHDALDSQAVEDSDEDEAESDASYLTPLGKSDFSASDKSDSEDDNNDSPGAGAGAGAAGATGGAEQSHNKPADKSNKRDGDDARGSKCRFAGVSGNADASSRQAPQVKKLSRKRSAEDAKLDNAGSYFNPANLWKDAAQVQQPLPWPLKKARMSSSNDSSYPSGSRGTPPPGPMKKKFSDIQQTELKRMRRNPQHESYIDPMGEALIVESVEQEVQVVRSTLDSKGYFTAPESSESEDDNDKENTSKPILTRVTRSGRLPSHDVAQAEYRVVQKRGELSAKHRSCYDRIFKHKEPFPENDADFARAFKVWQNEANPEYIRSPSPKPPQVRQKTPDPSAVLHVHSRNLRPRR